MGTQRYNSVKFPVRLSVNVNYQPSPICINPSILGDAWSFSLTILTSQSRVVNTKYNRSNQTIQFSNLISFIINGHFLSSSAYLALVIENSINEGMNERETL